MVDELNWFDRWKIWIVVCGVVERWWYVCFFLCLYGWFWSEN